MPRAISRRQLLLAAGGAVILLIGLAVSSHWVSRIFSPPTFPMTFLVTPASKIVIEKVFITQYEKYSMLHLRCHWIGDNLARAYRIRAGLDGFNHYESRMGLTWYVPKPRTADQPGERFSLDIKNPPNNPMPLPVTIRFRPRPGAMSLPQENLNLVIKPQDIEHLTLAEKELFGWVAVAD